MKKHKTFTFISRKKRKPFRQGEEFVFNTKLVGYAVHQKRCENGWVVTFRP